MEGFSMNSEELKLLSKTFETMSNDEFAEALSTVATSLMKQFDKDNKEEVKDAKLED